MFFFFFFKPYVAIIGDIKNSRELQNRKQVQEKLEAVLNEINETYDTDIASKFLITLGDEFQGLLHCGIHTMHIISKIERSMYPVELRFGVGIGPITTEVHRDMAIGADGPGYYKAREAIEYLKENEKRKMTGPADVRFEFSGEKQSSIIMINTILTLMSAIRESWSDRQRIIVWDMLEHQDNQTEAAKRLNVKQPTIQKALARGNYYAYKEALDTIGQALEEIRPDDV